jgi:hypothetical protein
MGVMPAHSRSKNGVASLPYVAGIHVFRRGTAKAWMAGTSPAMTIRSSDFGNGHAALADLTIRRTMDHNLIAALLLGRIAGDIGGPQRVP